MKKKIAVVLSGCGGKDGSEITEAISLLIGISEHGGEVFFFAPNESFPTYDYLNSKPNEEKLNALQMAARMARGKIDALENLNVKNFDGLAFPGGMGAAKNLSQWSEKQFRADVHPEVKRVIMEFYDANKPIAAICIAPVLLGLTLGKKKVTLTLGNNPEVISLIEKTGAQHEICPATDYVTDRDTKVITTPAYMCDDALPHEVFKGISGLAKELVEMA